MDKTTLSVSSMSAVVYKIFVFQAGVLPCSASSPAAPCTTCLFHLEFFSAPPLSSQSLSLWGGKKEMWIPISPFACKHILFYAIFMKC